MNATPTAVIAAYAPPPDARHGQPPARGASGAGDGAARVRRPHGRRRDAAAAALVAPGSGDPGAPVAAATARLNARRGRPRVVAARATASAPPRRRARPLAPRLRVLRRRGGREAARGDGLGVGRVP